MKNNKMTFLLNTIAILAMTLFGSCRKDGGGVEEQNTTGNAYKVSGIVNDTKNKPIANAKVRVVNTVLLNRSADVFTKSDGKYITPKLDLGGWNIYAWADIEYEGLTYHLRVAPEDKDYNAFSLDEKGLLKNFKLQLSGRIGDVPLSANSPATGYYGGTLLFINLPSGEMSPMAAGTEVKVIMTPVAGSKYIDGSEPQTIERKFTIEQNKSNYFLTDIPQCKYKITASTNNRNILLSDFRDITGKVPYKESLTYFFKPEPASSYNSGLQSNIDTPFFMELF